MNELSCMLSASLMLLFSHCQEPMSLTPTPNDVDAIELAPGFAEAGVEFGWQVLREEFRDDQNVVLSPFSLTMALGMAWNGAAGTTRAEMSEVLGWSAISEEQVNSAMLDLLAIFEHGDPSVQIEVANSLWADESFVFAKPFLQKVRDHYFAQLFARDLQSSDTAAEINRWCAEHTNNRIAEIVDSVPADVVSLLINALWFRGDWTQKFDAQLTKDEPFHRADGTVVDVPRMQRRGEFPYFENERLQAVELAYGDQQRFAMNILLPKPGTTLATLVSSMTGEQWASCCQQLRQRPGLIELPRFRAECSLTLGKALQALGMKQAFHPQLADFSALSDSEVPLSIDSVQQKVFLEVNEEGTEAAAVTSVGVRATSLGPPPFAMIVDRPFLVVIRELRNGAVLFVGSIADPSS